MASQIKPIYFGPKAIFDPYFIPPELLHRKSEEEMLSTILKDSFLDNFGANILIKGIKGVGKTVLINKAISDLKIKSKDNGKDILKLFVNCEGKNLEEIIISLILNLEKTEEMKLDINFLVNLTIPRLWNILKLACKKCNTFKFLVFHNIEEIEPKIFKKFLRFGKEMKISIISTINKISINPELNFLSEFDVKKRIDLYNPSQLSDIIKQRFALTYPFNIDDSLSNLIVDLVAEYDYLRPGKCIELMREIYPIIKKKNGSITSDHLREQCLLQFDSFSLDEFEIISYLTEADILIDIFLDNLANYFSNEYNYYIDLVKLKELYEISCETLEFEKKSSEFNRILQKLLDLEILKESKFVRKYPNNIRFFYSIMQTSQLKTMIDVIFGEIK